MNRAKRKQKRNTAQHALSNLDFILAKEQLAKESVFDKNQLRDLKDKWQQKITTEQEELYFFTDEISEKINHQL